MSRPDALFLITARSGSRRLPQKNIARLDGRSLLAYKVAAIRHSRTGRQSPILLSTDSAAYAAMAKGDGVEAPFLRPRRLATDRAASSDVVLHAMRWLEQRGRAAEVLVLIEPTTPFLLPEDIDGCVDLLMARRAEAVVTCSEHKIPARYIAPLERDGRIRPLLARMVEQPARTPEYTPNGLLYVTRWSSFKRRRTFYHERTYAHVTPVERSVEIDLPMDWRYAQAYAASQDWQRISPWRRAR